MATLPSLASVTGEASDFPLDAIEVGRIAGAWGLKGDFKVQAYASDPQALFSSTRWFLKAAETTGPGSRKAPPPHLLHISKAKDQATMVVASAREVVDRDAAEALAGARVFVSRANFPTAGDSEYYWVDLIGLSVINRDGVALGTVTGLIDTGVHSVLRVLPPGVLPAQASHEERLIPFVGVYIDQVDLEARLIRVDWGLDF